MGDVPHSSQTWTYSRGPKVTIEGDFTAFRAAGKSLRDNLLAATADANKLYEDDCGNFGGSLPLEHSSNMDGIIHSLPGHGREQFLIIPIGLPQE